VPQGFHASVKLCELAVRCRAPVCARPDAARAARLLQFLDLTEGKAGPGAKLNEHELAHTPESYRLRPPTRSAAGSRPRLS